MTETTMIRESFGLLAANAGEAIPAFFKRLFEIAPHLRKMFPGDLKAHEGRFTMMLVWLVERVDQPDVLIPALRDLGARHRVYGVTPDMFPPAGQALIETFRSTLGDEFTAEVEDCWVSLFATVTAEMTSV